jgi:hypothetical protein
VAGFGTSSSERLCSITRELIRWFIGQPFVCRKLQFLNQYLTITLISAKDELYQYILFSYVFSLLSHSVVTLQTKITNSLFYQSES